MKWKEQHHHILTNMPCLVKWWTGPDVSGLICVHRYTRPHIHRQTKTPSHTDGQTADGLNAEHVHMFLYWFSFTGIRGHTLMDRPIHHHTLIDKRLMGEVLKTKLAIMPIFEAFVKNTNLTFLSFLKKISIEVSEKKIPLQWDFLNCLYKSNAHPTVVSRHVLTFSDPYKVRGIWH